MSEKQRLSGGDAEREAPPLFELYLGFVNELIFLKKDKGTPTPVIPPRLAEVNTEDSQQVREIFEGYMEDLELIIRAVSEKFAFHILRSSDYFSGKDDKTLRNILKNTGEPIFVPAVNLGGPYKFFDCLCAYYQIDSLKSLIETLKLNFNNQKEMITIKFKSGEFIHHKFFAGHYVFSWHDNFKFELIPEKSRIKNKDCDIYAKIKLNDWISIMDGIEPERIKTCECRRLFWAKRLNRKFCYICQPAGETKPTGNKSHEHFEEVDQLKAKNSQIKNEIYARPEYEEKLHDETLVTHFNEYSPKIGDLDTKNGKIVTVVGIPSDMSNNYTFDRITKMRLFKMLLELMKEDWLPKWLQ